MNQAFLRAVRLCWRGLILSAALLVPASAVAQSGSAPIDAGGASPASSVVSTDPSGRVLVHATRISQPMHADGRLDEPAYRDVPSIHGLIQQVPKNGTPVSEQTEMWLLFDDDNLYFSCRCGDSNPKGIVANDMRRDSTSITNQDGIAIGLDTFNDHRSGYTFTLTAAGALRDGTTNEERSNFDWNTVFDGAATRSDEGWIGEMVIPFKSLRYRPGREQTWGIQLRRNIRSKNEMAYITKVNPAWLQRALHHYSEAATLVGLEAPPAAHNLEVKPYAMSSLTTDRLARPAINNELKPDVGVDVKYGVTESLTADLTYNTDFAQVEADEAQVNLTRFSIVFPEKREFFLEGGDIFNFGRSPGGDLGGDAPNIFYSRRIGLSGARPVPVLGGGRLTGKAGPWTLGALNIETQRDTAAKARQTNFTVVRMKRDILRQSSVGLLLTNRSVATAAPGGNFVWGADGSFTFVRNVFLTAYVAQSRTEGRSGNDLNYRGQFNYTSDRYGLAFDRIVVEKDFNPEVGFVPRTNFRRNLAQARFSPRTTRNRIVRQWNYQGDLNYVTDNGNRLESRNLAGTFRADLHNSDALTVQYSRLYEFLAAPFAIATGVRIPTGGYGFTNTRVEYSAGSQHQISGSSSFEVGSFYNGNKKTAAFRGRVELTTQLGVEPNISLNWIDLPQKRFTNTVIGGRTVYTMTPRMFVAALVQYSSSNTSLSTNLRFRWEYLPGSELFVVYTEGRSTLGDVGVPLENRGLVVKFNRLFRF